MVHVFVINLACKWGLQKDYYYQYYYHYPGTQCFILFQVNENLFPCKLSNKNTQLAEEAVQLAVKTWGQRSLSELEAEERLSYSCEKVNFFPAFLFFFCSLTLMDNSAVSDMSYIVHEIYYVVIG